MKENMLARKVEPIYEEAKGNEDLACGGFSLKVISMIKKSPELATLFTKSVNSFELILQASIGQERSKNFFDALLGTQSNIEAAAPEFYKHLAFLDQHQFVIAQDTFSGRAFLVDVTLKQYDDQCDEPWFNQLIEHGYVELDDHIFHEYLRLRCRTPELYATIETITIDSALSMESQNINYMEL